VGPCSGDGVWDCVVARPGIGFQGLANIGSTCEASVAADLGEVRGNAFAQSRYRQARRWRGLAA
jgi:hypothetical protein